MLCPHNSRGRISSLPCLRPHLCLYANGMQSNPYLSEWLVANAIIKRGRCVITDTNLFLCMDVLERASALFNVIVLQGGLEEVRARTLPLYNRLRPLQCDSPPVGPRRSARCGYITSGKVSTNNVRWYINCSAFWGTASSIPETTSLSPRSPEPDLVSLF